MSYALSGDVRLYYEETGTGYPIVFVHEFASDVREWEPQVRWFSREYRCITFNARGYPPSDVPERDDAYGYTYSADDIAAVMRHLGIAKAHVVGLSMGAYATLQFGIRHGSMASALVASSCGSGSHAAQRADFQKGTAALAQMFLDQGSAAVARAMGVSPTRIQLLLKDPRSWNDFVRNMSEHSNKGSAYTMRNYQMKRPPLTDFTDQFSRLAVPTLIVAGDEDEPCLESSLFLKRTIPTAGLWICPRTGHAVNLEEPAEFNRQLSTFFGSVERGKWGPRDPRAMGHAILGDPDRKA